MLILRGFHVSFMTICGCNASEIRIDGLIDYAHMNIKIVEIVGTYFFHDARANTESWFNRHGGGSPKSYLPGGLEKQSRTDKLWFTVALAM
jgi:hypothetical protein